MIQFLRGMLAMACLVAALLFVRFWRHSRERLLLVFGAAFGLFALNWTMLAYAHPGGESSHYLFLTRFLGFALIIVGILDKNRARH
jgi:hypothetical protein